MGTDSPDTVTCACVQTSSGPDRARNIVAARGGIADAAARGARLVALPEAVDLLDPDAKRMRALAFSVDEHPAVRAFSEDARRLGLWISVGSVTARNAQDEVVNRSILLAPSGAMVCHYDKIHLFDASIAGPASQGESAIYTRGREARVAETPWGFLGLAICYDLRFPHLFRALAHAGATLLTVPSGFLRVTGEAHWHVLVRARAIENGAFVIAAGQCGSPYPGRHDYGHSLIVDPWGRVLAEAGDQPEVIVAELQLSEIAKCRSAVPSLSQDQAIRVVRADAADDGPRSIEASRK